MANGSARKPPKDIGEWLARSFEVGQLFSPSAPLNQNDLFAGRMQQIRKVLASTSERGKHVILYGERGVGKTSLVTLLRGFFPETLRHIFVIREQADPSDNFKTIWRKVFRDIEVRFNKDGREETSSLAAFYQSDISPDDVRRELGSIFQINEVPILIIDEYDKIADNNVHELMANTIKSLSDYGITVTMVLVGVADNVNELIGEHPSINRCVEQVLMPRMSMPERIEILDKIIPRLGMVIDQKSKMKIALLSKGLPSYVHLLGMYAAQTAIERQSLKIQESDVEVAMKRALEKSEESTKDEYLKATHSNRADNLYQEVLLACALAETDEKGSFAPLSVCAPLTKILKRTKDVEIAAFQQHLKKFITDERGSVLVRRGRDRAFRFRFRDPMMQPYVIMKGIEQGLVDKEAIGALSVSVVEDNSTD